MTKIVNKKYIKDFVKNNIQYLTKNNLIDIAKKYNIPIKISDYKDNIAKAITDAKGVDYWDIYTTYKGYAFGLYPKELEQLLDIDKKQRKKLENDLVKVAYHQESKADWGKVNVPYYDLESLYTLDKSKLDEWKERNKSKKATPKQLEALSKAREEARLRLTCGICGHQTSKKYITNRVCDNCRESIQEDIERESFIECLNTIKKEPGKYIIAHFETTGLSSKDEIVSCSVVDLNGNILMDEILKPNCKISDEASYVHNINNEIVNEKGISREEFISKFKKISTDKEILIWNLDFLREKIINFINGGYLKRYWYNQQDKEYNEKDYLEYKKKEKERRLLYESVFPKTYDLYINYAYINYEIDRFYESDIWTSVHKSGYLTKNQYDFSITTRACLIMLNYINTERKPLELPQFWIDNNLEI